LITHRSEMQVFGHFGKSARPVAKRPTICTDVKLWPLEVIAPTFLFQKSYFAHKSLKSKFYYSKNWVYRMFENNPKNDVLNCFSAKYETLAFRTITVFANSSPKYLVSKIAAVKYLWVTIFTVRRCNQLGSRQQKDIEYEREDIGNQSVYCCW
jgi:hypothetical protein